MLLWDLKISTGFCRKKDQNEIKPQHNNFYSFINVYKRKQQNIPAFF